MAKPKHSRAKRGPGGRTKAWRKSQTSPTTATGWTINRGVPWVPKAHRLANYRRHTERGDAAALVEAIRECHQDSVPVPEWVVPELEQMLAEVIIVFNHGKGKGVRVRHPRFVPWAREYLVAWKDWMIAEHIETNIRVYGLQRVEAIDEAVCSLRGTPLEGTQSTLEYAWKRARRRAREGWFQRLPTTWEDRLFRILCPSATAESPRHCWMIINADRQGDSRGEWRERPRLLADLSVRELEREADRVRARGRKG